MPICKITPRGEGNCETIERQDLSRGNFFDLQHLDVTSGPLVFRRNSKQNRNCRNLLSRTAIGRATVTLLLSCAEACRKRRYSEDHLLGTLLLTFRARGGGNCYQNAQSPGRRVSLDFTTAIDAAPAL